MSSKFSTARQKFKVIQSSSSSIAISPMQSNQVFSVSVAGGVLSQTLPAIVSTVCGLYASNLSSNTALITDELMQSVVADSDFATLFSEYGFTGRWTSDTHRNYAIVSKIGSYSYKLEIWHVNGGSTKTARVYPVITLKNTVRFSGSGTSASPYTIAIP